MGPRTSWLTLNQFEGEQDAFIGKKRLFHTIYTGESSISARAVERDEGESLARQSYKKKENARLSQKQNQGKRLLRFSRNGHGESIKWLICKGAAKTREKRKN